MTEKSSVLFFVSLPKSELPQRINKRGCPHYADHLQFRITGNFRWGDKNITQKLF